MVFKDTRWAPNTETKKVHRTWGVFRCFFSYLLSFGIWSPSDDVIQSFFLCWIGIV